MSSSLAWSSYLARGVPPTKRMLIGANWKCNGTLSQVKALTEMLNNGGQFPLAAEVVIAVPSIHLHAVKATIRSDIAISSQDVAVNTGYGAYTGELSGALLVDSGIKWTLVGHSERRAGFGFPGEPSAVAGAKTKAAITAGLNVIACIGEQLVERENGTTMKICAEQLGAIASQLTITDWEKVVIAYEPVWAIGTGKVATPEQAEETHTHIRNWISDNVSAQVAREVRIIYGGSVKGNNCVSLMACPNIDGFLVGGASLLPEFIDIIKSAK